MTKYKVGDKVRIVEERTKSMNLYGHMDKYLGTVMTIITTDKNSNYKMLEDNGEWSWDDSMIEGPADEKVELHPDFAEWYGEIKDSFASPEIYMSCAIYLINQMGHGHGLENSSNEDVTEDYAELRKEMQTNKEKYTRAILDNSWTVRKEKLYYVKFPLVDRGFRFLNQNKGIGITIFSDSLERCGYETKFTEKEIKAIDERYFAFAEPVEED